MIDIEKIDYVEHLRKEEARIRREQSQVTGEMPFSLESLKAVYAITRANADKFSYSESKVREYFLFVALYMFDPTSIVRKMKKGLRVDLAETLGVSENNISHLTKNILFRYRHYKSFREDCDRIHTETMALIERLSNDTTQLRRDI